MPLFTRIITGSMSLLRDAPLYRQNPTFGNPGWEEAGMRILILRLSCFRDVQKSSPHLFLAAVSRRVIPDCYIDMAFLPRREDRDLFAASGVPLILGTQSHRSLQDFDLALVSNSCVPELANLPFLLAGSGAPLWAGERGPQWPALILGGSSSAAAHGCVREDGDCMADAMFFGEGEGAVEQLLRLWRGPEDEGKAHRMSRLADQVPGLWPAGDLSRRVRASSAPAVHAAPLPYPVLPGPEARTARLAVTRGCPCLCSFCFEGYDRRPFRQTPVEQLLSTAEELKIHGGVETLELESFNFNTHDGIARLLEELGRLFLRVNAMSQRADILARDNGLLECEIAAGKRSFTLGIEGMSASQRRFLHKSLADTDIRKAITALHRPPVREIKLFFLLTGREGPADLEELSVLVRWLKGMRDGAGPRVIFSFGLLVRMPFTPLRYDALRIEERQWRPLIGRAKSICETNGFEFRLASSWTDYCVTQAIAGGGYEARGLLEALTQENIVYDQEFPAEAARVLEKWLAALPAPRRVLFSSEKPGDHAFPLSFLETDEERNALFARYADAAAGRDHGYCRRGEPGPGCADCPACTLESRRGREGHGGSRTPAAGGQAIQRIRESAAAKNRLKPGHVRVWIPEEAAGSSPEWRDAWLLSRFLHQYPGQSRNVLSVREVLVTAWAGDGAPPWSGNGVASVLAWDLEEALAPLAAVPAAEELPWSFHTPLPAGAEVGWVSLGVRLCVHLAVPARAMQEIPAALEAQHTPVTVRKGEGWHQIEVAPRALRRRGLLGGRYAEEPGLLSLELSVGPRFDAAAFLAHVTGPAGGAAVTEMEITDIRL